MALLVYKEKFRDKIILFSNVYSIVCMFMSSWRKMNEEGLIAGCGKVSLLKPDPNQQMLDIEDRGIHV